MSVFQWRRKRPFNPNWVSAPAATLEDILEEGHLTIRELAEQGARWMFEKSAEPVDIEGQTARFEGILQRVLDRQPYGDAEAWVLSWVVGSSVDFWKNREQHYRDGLAAGLKEF